LKLTALSRELAVLAYHFGKLISVNPGMLRRKLGARAQKVPET
jgi:hypothetical protein